MFNITAEQLQYQSYILSDETSSSSVVVVPHKGGILTNWRCLDQEIFYLDTERFKDPQLSVRGGIPLLFPICGNLADDSYNHEGKTYKLVQHGFARNLPWKVTNQSTDTAASLTVTLKSDELTLDVYPWDFELNFIYTLKGNTLELRYRHTNLSEKPMPFATGIHPYFSVANKDKLKFDIPSDHYQTKNDPTLKSFAGKFDFEQEEIDFTFMNLSKNYATVTDLDRNFKLTVNYDDNYSTIIFWTVKNKDFYCLEPWSSPRNALNTGKNLLTAEPGQTVETVILMTVEPLIAS